MILLWVQTHRKVFGPLTSQTEEKLFFSPVKFREQHFTYGSTSVRLVGNTRQRM